MNDRARTGVGFLSNERRRLVVAALIPLSALGLQWAFLSSFKPFAWILFYPGVFLSAWIGGLRSGLASVAFSTLAIWWFFLPNRSSGFIELPACAFTMVVFASVGVVVSFTLERMRKAERRAADALVARGPRANAGGRAYATPPGRHLHVVRRGAGPPEELRERLQQLRSKAHRLRRIRRGGGAPGNLLAGDQRAAFGMGRAAPRARRMPKLAAEADGP